MNSLLTVILPAIITILGNALFYVWLKARIDNSIEKHKVVFSGIYKERLDIYKELLKQMYDLKRQLQKYQNSGDPQGAETFKLDTNKFIRFYMINRPFLSEKVTSELIKLRTELQSVFEDLFMHHSLFQEKGIESKERTEFLKKFIEARNKLVKNDPFSELENRIISEVKAKLHLDRFKSNYHNAGNMGFAKVGLKN